MKFSIIIPIYKVEKYLHECVDSVLSQTFTDFEVILVDDGSPDNCPEMCDDYARKDARIKVVHQKNAGLACARNSGIKIASGEYLICIDSDDYLSNSNVLEKIAAKADGKTDVVLYGFKKFFESNSSFGTNEVPNLTNVSTTSEMLASIFGNNSYCGTAWTKAVKLSILHDNNIEFRPGMISEDIDWYIHLMCFAKTYDSVNEAVVIYRQRPGSISHDSKLNSLTDNLWILEEWPNRINSLVPESKTRTAMMRVMAYYYANDMILFSGYPRKVSKPYKKRFKAQAQLLDYAVTPRALTVRKFYRVFGFDITILLLRILSKLKTRQ